MHPDDHTLVDALLRQDEDAFVAFFQRVHPRLVALVRRIAPLHAEDVAQDTWLTVLRALAQFDGRSRLETWVLQIAVNRARTVRSRREREVELAPGDAGSEDQDPLVGLFGRLRWRTPVASWAIEASPENAAQNHELVALVSQGLETLPETQRLVVLLRDVEGVSAEDACTIVGLSEANQRVLLHRGRARVRAYVDAMLTEFVPFAHAQPK